ncbi:MAG: dihydrofolate reductase family protein, partial [Burkholderiaceae bacterium]|nr:dihydrofolate reductase family protein [Microbacteriaceae bacterium]
TARTRIARSFDPVAVAAMVRSADRDVGIGGASFASHAIAAGLVDEYRMFLNPLLVGGGTRFLPHGVNLELELVDERRFADGVVYLAYRPR